MVKSKNNARPPATSATSATRGANEFTWDERTVAEDELSVLRIQTAEIATAEHASEAASLSQTDTFWPQIEALAKSCDEILLKKGFPRAAQMVQHDGAGNWWHHAPNAPECPPTGETWKFTRGGALAQEYSDDFSDGWYAGRIGFKCKKALELFQNGDADKPFFHAKIFEIATLEAEWRWRRASKPSILTGQKQRQTLANHRNTAHAKQSEKKELRRQAILKLMHENKPKITGLALQEYLKKNLLEHFGIKAAPRTIRRDLSELSQ